MQKTFFLSIIILLFIGVNVFGSFAWNIEDGKVSFIQSLLPAIYILIILFIIKIFSTNFNFFYKQKNEEFHLLLFLFLIVIIKNYWGHSGYLGGIINSMLIPVFVSILMPIRRFKKSFHINSNFKDITQKIIIYFFIIECSIAIFEKILQINLFPISTENLNSITNEISTAEFRSTALINHPLQNALSVSIIMSFILTSKIKDSYKYSLWILGYLAILCFNTRSSIYIWIILFSLFVGHELFINRRISINRKFFLFYCSLFILASMSILVFKLGWGARIIIMRLIDNDSSAVRIKIWDVFEKFNWEYFMIGHNNIQILSMINSVDVLIVENYWLINIFTYGFILTLGIIYFFFKLFKRILIGFSLFSKLFVLSCFFSISSTNNSLSVASPAMAIFIICCYIFNPRIYCVKNKINI